MKKPRRRFAAADDPTLCRGRPPSTIPAAQRLAMTPAECREFDDALWASLGAPRGLTGQEARRRLVVLDDDGRSLDQGMA